MIPLHETLATRVLHKTTQEGHGGREQALEELRDPDNYDATVLALFKYARENGMAEADEDIQTLAEHAYEHLLTKRRSRSEARRTAGLRVIDGGRS